ncbi:Nucleolar protein 4-like [Lamellibrachia satsuma]|nr:Nucleolar protein 4-like [Lamellibrachia satsuma]
MLPETTLKNSGESAFPVAMITETSEAAEAPATAAAGENGDTATCCKTPTHTVLTPPSGRSDDRGHPERKRRASNDSADSSTKTSECYADDTGKDDDDDNEDDDDDKLLVGHDKDPERLKAFNMFVRLFVDENLDRMVPISKQPKDKIQAILEACDRQFPEFHERSRKRIRTYLKSCRRMRRSKETTNGWEPLRPTPPHLTSAAAESILAHACENESSNAKRMRMGLDPLPAKAMSPTSTTLVADSPAPQTPHKAPVRQPSPAAPQPPAPPTAGSPPTPPRTLDVQLSVVRSDYLHHAPPLAPTAFRPPPHDIPPPPPPPSTFFTNGNGFFRPGFPATYPQHPAHHHPPVIQHTPLTNQLGPTDLSMKKCSSPTSLSKSQLNPSEVTTIKQLIAGYRESAAFLYRSADELEQLLLHHN